MIPIITQLIVLCLIVGFVYWVWTLIRPLLPLPAPVGQVVDILVLVLVVAIIIFYALIPLIQSASHLLPAGLR